MSRRLILHTDLADRLPRAWSDWAGLTGEQVAVSGTTSTEVVRSGGLRLYLKRYRYPLGVALRNLLRNTWRRPSRACREYRMLGRFRSRAGRQVAPAPAALGERRVLGLLREAFLATVEVAGAAPLSERLPEDAAAPERLARFLADLHGAGLVHGGLFARNVLASGSDRYLVVDLDRARCGKQGRAMAVRRRAHDLAFLDESIRGAPPVTRLRVLRGYLRHLGEEGRARRWLVEIERWRPVARGRLARRGRLET